ncbi:MAG: GNAT family N-acetyltransferase [Gemmatimonadaceae bacterium]|nr:GNAT family N-acetyltransferase [Gemmatimonadaceae bacterium]MCW5825280.1 GNAT family N-acetyltransferase [Gemmatimonadaceae bacterium]
MSAPLPKATDQVRPATAHDVVAVQALLREAALPLDGVPNDLADFLVAERDGAVVAAIGLERYGRHGLLRSAVVHPSLRGSGIGDALVTELLAHARRSGLVDLTLLTTTAAAWFPRFGFATVTRDEVPSAVHASAEFQGACPASATVMLRAL